MVSARRSRLAAGGFAAGLLLLPLTGCSADSGDATAAGVSSAAESAGSAASSAAGSAGSAASSAAGEVDDRVDCSGSSCSVTVDTGEDVDVLGTQLSLQSVADGQATLAVGDRTVSCAQGDEVSAGPLSLACTTISDDSVTLTVSLG